MPREYPDALSPSIVGVLMWWSSDSFAVTEYHQRLLDICSVIDDYLRVPLETTRKKLRQRIYCQADAVL
jgi:hypothetical protein